MSGGGAELTGERIVLVGRFDRLPATRLAREIALRGGAATRRLGEACTGIVIGQGAAGMIEDGRLASLTARARETRAWTAGEGAFLRRLDLTPPLGAENRTLSAAELARRAEIDPATVEALRLFGVVDEEQGAYGFRDLVAARQVAALLRSGATLAEIIAAATELRRRTPGENPLARERLTLAEDGSLALCVAERVADLSGQLRLPLQLGPRRATLDLLVAAEEAAEIGRHDDAIAWYRRYVGAAPDDAVAHFNLAGLLCEAGEREEAKYELMNAVRLDPRLVEGWYNLAHLAEETGRVDAAVTYLDRALAIDPGYGDALYNRARLALAAEDFPTAAEHYERYLEGDAASEWGRRARRGLLYCRLMLREQRAQ
jgi:tetratricopeptide (TPR) repeat protein